MPIYKKGKLPDVEALMESTGEDLDEELLDEFLEIELQQHIEKGLWFIEKKELRKAFIEDVNKDIQILTESKRLPPDVRKKYSARTTRYIKLLRVHGLVKKAAKENRYLLTTKGQKFATALMNASAVGIKELTEMAA
ncbi:hypothetical protein ACFL02_01720 [Planctomycetota bacterium]